VALLNSVLPDEWWVELLSTVKRRLRDAFALLVLAIPVLASVRIPRAERRPALLVLFLPLVVGVALLSVSLLVENYDAFYGRYLSGALPGLGVFAALALRRVFGERALTWSAASVTVLLLALWAHPRHGHAGHRLAPFEHHVGAEARHGSEGPAQVPVEDRHAARLARAVRLRRGTQPVRPAHHDPGAVVVEVANYLALHRGARDHAGGLDVVAGWVRTLCEHVEQRRT
jgi:hypothetical protein